MARIFRNLSQQHDVSITNPADGEALLYSTAVSKWVPGTVAGGGGGGGSFSLGASTGGNTAGQTGVTGTRVVLVGGNNVTLSQATAAAGATITISGADTFAQTVQTQNLHNISLSGNTAGAMAQVSSGTVTLAGGNGITLSQNGNAITISGNTFAQSVQPETQTFVGGVIASDTTYTSGSVRFTGVGGGITVSSNTGQRVDLSVAAQSVQPGVQHLVASNATFSSGTVSISGFGDVTVNTAANIIRISAPVQTAQTGISSIVASDATYTSGSVQFTGSNMVTVRSSANQRVVIDATQSVQTQNLHNVTLSGNTAGVMAQISSGTLTLAGGNNITVSQNGNAVTISGPNVGGAQTGISGLANSETTYTSGSVTFSELGAITIRSTTGQQFQFSVNSQTVQTVGMYAVGNTTGQSSSTTRDARSISVDGAGAVSVGYSGGTLRISAPVQTAQTGISGVANSQTTYTSGTVSLGELGAITIRSTTGNQYQFSVAAQTAESQSLGMSNLGNTSGTTGIASGAQVRYLLAGGNNVTLSQSLNGASGTVTISAANQTVQPGVQHLVASDATFSSGTVSISGFGDVTVNTAASLIRISAPVQTAESQSVGMSNLGNTSGTTGIASGAQVRMLFAGAGEVTLSQSLNGASGTLTISAPVQTVESQSIGMSNVGNTSGTTGVASGGQVRFVFAGGNNITLSQSLNGASGTITISAPNLGAGAMSAGVSNIGNSAGATGITGTQLVLVGSDNITLSQTTGANGGTVSIIGPAAGGFSAGVSTGGNTAGDTGVTGTRMVWVGTGPISLSQATAAAGGTVSINAPATSSLVGVSGISISTNGSTVSIMQTTGSQIITSLAPYDESPMVTGQQGQGTLHISPLRVPEALQFDRIALGMQISNASNSSGSVTISNWVGLYTRNASTLSLLASTSISTNFSGSGTAGSYSLYGGPRWHTIGWTTTLTDGDYFIGFINRTTTGGANVSVSQMLVSKFTNVDWSGQIGAASNATLQRNLGQGHYTASTSSMPASIAFTQLNGTNSIVLRNPVYMFRSGTV